MATAKADWLAIEKFMMLTEDYAAAAKQYNVKEDTIRKRAKRHAWPLPSIVAEKALALRAAGTVQKAQNGGIIEQSAKNLAQRGEEHADMVFRKANDALNKMKEFPIENARDVELIDRVARRAAGLGNDETDVKISIVGLNERLERHNVIEAELVEESVSEPSESLALPS